MTSPMGAVLHGAEDLRYETVAREAVGPGEIRVRLGAAGICGSDQHYYRHAQMGQFVLRAPFALGHEMSGDVVEAGENSCELKAGDRVVVDPALTCGVCPACRSGRANLCHNVRFMGSASHHPHLHGGYRDEFVVDARRCVKAPVSIPHGILALTEPLSVAVHATERAGNLMGRDVLITGAGPIGALLAACARGAGAASVTVSDPSDFRRSKALEMGADAVTDPLNEDMLREAERYGGLYDVAFEASGVAAGFSDAVRTVKRGGRAVLVGMIPTSSCEVPFDHMTTREIDLISTFRQNGVFERAARMLVEKRIDASPIVTGTFALQDVLKAFRTSFDIEQHIKVLLRGPAWEE